MKLSTLGAIFALSAIAIPAHALVVAPGCIVPTTNFNKTIYVDPVRGNDANNGSQNKPWKSIQASKVRGLNLILLNSGSYGAVSLNSAKLSQFATVRPMTGKTPVFTSLQILGSTRWLVQGVTIQSLKSGTVPLVKVGSNATGRSAQIVLDTIAASSADSSATWSNADWLANARQYAFSVDGSDLSSTGALCVTITNSAIKNVRFGFSTTANSTMISRNTITDYADDGIDYAASNLVISNNTITNNHIIGDGNSNSGIQRVNGYGNSGTVFANVSITGNSVSPGGGSGGGGDTGGGGSGGGGDPGNGDSGGNTGGFILANYNNAACEQPATTYAGTIHYIDPVLGNDSNNGLAPGSGHAWATIKSYSAGDDIRLYSGAYGAFSIQNQVMASWTKISAVAGQTPVFTSFNMSGSQRWLVQGIKVQHNPGAPNFEELAAIHHGSGAAKNIVIDSSSFSTADDGSAWNQATWKNAVYFGFDILESAENAGDVSCIALSRNHFAWLRNNLSLAGNYLLATDNEFDNPGGDSIDFAGNNISILRNYAHDQHGVDWTVTCGCDGDHNDFIQAQIGLCATLCTRSHILIDGNVAIERTNPTSLASGENNAEGMQGISAFDEDWNDVTVTNNVLATSAIDIISWAGVHTGNIANNVAVQTIGTAGGISIVLRSHESTTDAAYVHVWNNITSNLGGEGPTTTNTFDHNLILSGGSFNYWPPGSGSSQFNHVVGTFGTGNVISAQLPSAAFQTYVFSTRTYDFHLKAGSLGLGVGGTPAPNHSDGTARTTPVDLGAY